MSKLIVIVGVCALLSGCGQFLMPRLVAKVIDKVVVVDVEGETNAKS
jgi:hypothetical protein